MQLKLTHEPIIARMLKVYMKNIEDETGVCMCDFFFSCRRTVLAFCVYMKKFSFSIFIVVFVSFCFRRPILNPRRSMERIDCSLNWSIVLKEN